MQQPFDVDGAVAAQGVANNEWTNRLREGAAYARNMVARLGSEDVLTSVIHDSLALPATVVLASAVRAIAKVLALTIDGRDYVLAGGGAKIKLCAIG